MSVLRNSVENLHSKILKLENAMNGFEVSLEGQQRDMFAAPPSNENASLNKEEVSKRLDSAIEKVEQLLKSGTDQ